VLINFENARELGGQVHEFVRRYKLLIMSNISNTEDKIEIFRNLIEKCYAESKHGEDGFDTILCYELHYQPVNPRMGFKTSTGYEVGLNFKELAQKWGISLSFLGELIADHCKRLEGK